jgi:hypothetical protein
MRLHRRGGYITEGTFRSVRHQTVSFAHVSPPALLLLAMLPVFQPLPVVRRSRPFNASDWLFELKYHGFRALDYVDYPGGRLCPATATASLRFLR